MVYIVILNYNHLEDLKETIHSFLEQSYPNTRIIVSDNGSTDNSIKWLHKNHPEIIVIENKKNLGWAEGNNVGIRYALKHNADYILLANNDLSFKDPSIIDSLLKAYDRFPKLGIIGPSQNSYFEKDKIVNQGWIMFPKVKHSFNKNRLEYIRKNDIPFNYKVIDNVSGSFMIIKREVFDDVGEIDNDLFLYAEDADFSLRAWKMGWISLVDSSIMIYHKVSATAGINSPLKIYYMTRNLIYLIRKHRDIQSSYRFFARKYYFDIVKQFIKMSIKKEYRKKKVKRLKALFLGFYHGAIIKKVGQFY